MLSGLLFFAIIKTLSLKFLLDNGYESWIGPKNIIFDS
jgi:hypothetical protein